jgi:hypothetical protein
MDSKKYRKKPVVIEAFQYDGDLKNKDGFYYVPQWAVDAFESDVMYYDSLENEPPSELFIKTLEGIHHVSVGDYVIQGIQGELYPCKPDIFRKTYEEVDISKTETISARALGCWYCTEIEKHGVVAVKTVLDKAGRELDAYETPYNFCPNCGRKIKED